MLCLRGFLYAQYHNLTEAVDKFETLNKRLTWKATLLLFIDPCPVHTSRYDLSIEFDNYFFQTEKGEAHYENETITIHFSRRVSRYIR